MLRLPALALLSVSWCAAQEKTLDPAAWGGNHAGQPVPEHVQGDECLFCHRSDIGPTWQKNAHGVAVRQREEAADLAARLKNAPPHAGEAEFFLGSRRRVRLLKREGYGRFALFDAQAILSPGHSEWTQGTGAWDQTKFADRCAGCHATGVDSKSRTFSTFGLDCYTCHGVVDLNHTKDTSLMWLSKKRRGDARAVTSICAQCHLRMGRSKSTGLPYANNFVAGDNLFQDYTVDFSRAGDPRLNPGDRHVLRNVRDVVLHGSDVTCLSCHRVHASSISKHRLVLSGPACQDCHNAEGPKKAVKSYTVHSELCEY